MPSIETQEIKIEMCHPLYQMIVHGWPYFKALHSRVTSFHVSLQTGTVTIKVEGDQFHVQDFYKDLCNYARSHAEVMSKHTALIEVAGLDVTLERAGKNRYDERYYTHATMTIAVNGTTIRLNDFTIHDLQTLAVHLRMYAKQMVDDRREDTT